MSIKTLQESLATGESIHHACLVLGSKEIVLPKITAFIEEDLLISISGNPDVHIEEYQSFGIDDGRALQNLASKTAFGEKKIFVTSFDSMTREAQNALLKLFEEPTPHTHFFLHTESPEQILKTLKSRLFIIDELESEAKHDTTTTQFLKSSNAERIELLSDIISNKDKRAAHHLLSAIEVELAKALHTDADNPNLQNGLHSVLEAKRYVSDRSSSLKLLLEHVSLTVPRL